jgi:hypothetical protein
VRIVVNHLTRMMKGYICAAGIDEETNEHVRPVLPGMRLRADLLEARGGPFNMAALVDLGETHSCGNAPETEDMEFHPALAARVRTLPGEEFWRLLRSVSESCLGDVFGSELERVGHTLAIEQGKGVVSLGCIAPKRAPTLAIDRFDRIRALVADATISVRVTVTISWRPSLVLTRILAEYFPASNPAGLTATGIRAGMNPFNNRTTSQAGAGVPAAPPSS